ncbi:MAG: hypothetical protein Rubg2KO_15080 [Rubricoccaceae bacterium]
MPDKAFPQTHDGMIDALEFVEAAMAGDDAELIDRAMLVAGEVLANAVEHGGSDPARRIRVSVERVDRQLDLIVEEPRRVVDVETVETSDLPEDLLATSGRGLFLIRTLADDVEPAGESRIRYVFRPRSDS